MTDTEIPVGEPDQPLSKEATNRPATLTENICVFSIFFIVLGICAIPIIILYLAALPLLILSFLVTRALQILWHRDDYHKAVQLKLYIRLLVFISTSWSVAGLAIFYGIAKQIPSFKQAVILETPLENWVILLFVIYGFYLLHFVLLLCIFKFVPNIPLDHYERGFNVPESVLEMIDCLILWLVLSQVEKRVPVFKADKLHGLYTRKWIEVTLIIFFVYNIIVLCTRLIIANKVLLKCLKKLCGIKGNSDKKYDFIMEKIVRMRYVKYCAIGLKHSIDFILSSLLFLLTWVFYFGSHLEETLKAERVFQVGTISCATLLVCAILWFIKTYLLLLWEVRIVYNRLGKQMVDGAKQLYFLGIFGCCCHRHDIFKLRNDDPTDDQSEGCISFCLELFPVWENKKKPSAKRRKKVQEDLLLIKKDLSPSSDSHSKKLKKDPSPSFYELRQIAYYFLQARETLKDDKYTNCDSDSILKSIASLKQRTSNGDTQAEDKIVWSYFVDQMSDGSDSPAATRDDEYSLQEIEKWMEKARSHCLFLANTLASAKELVRCLNNIFSWLLIAATFILWLLLNGFATTRVLVLFGSPFVAASFIFGDTCKTLFQGIIFVYVVRPFDVGDFCIIDEKMMEVRTIGVWITTFSKVDTQEEVTYPNSQLFTKTINNHKTNFDWNDHIELEVASVNIETKTLKKDIEDYFEKSSRPFTASLVVVSRAEKVTKIALTFKSNNDMKNRTYAQCLKEKQKLNSELLAELQDMVEQKMGINSSSNNSTCDSTDSGKSAARKSEEIHETHQSSSIGMINDVQV